MRYFRCKLHALRHRYREMSQIAVNEEPAAYRMQLRQFAAKGMAVMVAEDRGRIVGTLATLPASRLSLPPELRQAVLDAGAELKEVEIRTLIYTDGEYRGRRIASRLEELANSEAKATGHRFILAYGYASEEICCWLDRKGASIDLGIADSSGLPCRLIPVVV